MTSTELRRSLDAFMQAAYRLDSMMQHRWVDHWTSDDWREYRRLAEETDRRRREFEEAKGAEVPAV